MGFQIELDYKIIRKINLARKLSQERQDREEESLEEYVRRELKTTSEQSIVFHTDLNRAANSIYFDDEGMTDSEYVDENIDQIEAEVATDLE